MKKEFVSPLELEAMMHYIHLQLDDLDEKVTLAVHAQQQKLVATQRKKMDHITNAYREIEREFTMKQLKQAATEKEQPLMKMNPNLSY